MRSVCGFGIALLLSTGLFAQINRGTTGFVNTGGISRGFGSVVFPGGTSAMPGVTRTTGSVVFPGVGGPQIAVPAVPFAVPGRNGIGFNTNRGFVNGNGNGFGNGFRDGKNGFGKGNGFNNGNVIAYPVPYPVYGGGYGGGYDQPVVQQEPAQQPPNVIVVMPSGQGYAGYPAQGMYPGYPPAGGPGPQVGPAQSQITEVPSADQQPAANTTATHYLIALKDHSVYSAVAYFVDGQTLHYFTTGNAHSQVPISQVDRELTHRLNEDSGLEVKLPAAQ
jgi:hypothetical protein